MFPFLNTKNPSRFSTFLVSILAIAFAVLISITILPLAGIAQEGDEGEKTTAEQKPPYAFDINDLKTPASPAFALLDIESASVETIKKPDALALSIASLFQDGALPKDFAVEFAPYPMFKDWVESNMPVDKYFHPKLRTLFENLSISIATSPLTEYDQIEEKDVEIGTRIAVGLRTHLLYGKETDVMNEGEMKIPALAEAKMDFEGYSLEEMKKKLEMVEVLSKLSIEGEKTEFDYFEGISGEIKKIEADADDTLERLSEKVPEISPFIDEKIKAYEETNKMKEDSKTVLEDYQLLLEKLELLEQKEQLISNQLQDEERVFEKGDKQPAGFRLELATGAVANIPDDDWNRIKFARFGLWLTGAYRLQEIPFDAVIMGRYIRDETNSNPENIFDIGFSLKLEIDRLGLSGESVTRYVRSPLVNENLHCTTFNFQYRLTDDVYATITLGKNYDRNGDGSDLISQLGLSYEIGPNPVLKP